MFCFPEKKRVGRKKRKNLLCGSFSWEGLFSSMFILSHSDIVSLKGKKGGRGKKEKEILRKG